MKDFDAIDYDMSQIKENSFELMSPGYDKAIIIECPFKQSKDNATAGNSWGWLNLKVRIIEGPYANRMLFHKLFVNSESEKGQNWARGIVKRILRVVGKEGANKYSDMCGLPLMIKIKVKAADSYNPEPYNEIQDFLDINDSLLGLREQMPAFDKSSVQFKPHSDADLNDEIPF